mmetsp:Transcript_117940/g.328600  ORF Transcript_117940/g.328600 Transcript_117940/m.328600 type:complete len:123 (-) Transcript_117940:1430-1798(-)
MTAHQGSRVNDCTARQALQLMFLTSAKADVSEMASRRHGKVPSTRELIRSNLEVKILASTRKARAQDIMAMEPPPLISCSCMCLGLVVGALPCARPGANPEADPQSALRRQACWAVPCGRGQ